MDIFDPVRAHETPYAAYARITAHLTLVGISTDWLFPPEDVRSLAAIIQAAGTHCDYREMASNHGHDAFLAERDPLVRLATRRKAAATHCDYREMASNHGHDAFLAEPDQLVRLLTPVFE